MTRVLVVEDERSLLTALTLTLRGDGYEVDGATTAAAALALVTAAVPELIVLDLGLPDLDGTEVILRLRRWSDVPILVLSGRSDSSDKVRALDLGADDYVTKPFRSEELLARLRAMRRRHQDVGGQARVVVGRHLVDLVARTVTPAPVPAPVPGAEPVSGPVPEVVLTPTEWAVLEVLLRSPGRLTRPQEIQQRVWGSGQRRETDSLRTYLARLRRKLELDPSRPRHLLTEPGMGYRFQP